jgi:hypothetical protein
MPGQILGVESKTFWRTSRMLVWSFILNVAVLDIFNLVEPFKLLENPMSFVYIVAGWILAYHGLMWIRSRYA